MIFSKNKILGFTLIELIITVSIVVLMALVAVPTFSNYQKRSHFAQSTSEISDLINQYGLLAKNPELGVACYRMIDDSGSIIFSKYPSCSSSDSSIVDKNFNTEYFGDDTNIDIVAGLRCESESGNCFFGNAAVGTGIKTKILTISDNRIQKKAEYWVIDQPFSVELKMLDM